MVDEGSCIGDESCSQYGGGSFAVGKDSCLGIYACERKIADGSIDIGSGSCLEKQSCAILSTETSFITIGDRSCGCEDCCRCLLDGDNVPDDSCNEKGEDECCIDYDKRGTKLFTATHFINISIGKSACDLTVSTRAELIDFFKEQFEVLVECEYVLVSSEYFDFCDIPEDLRNFYLRFENTAKKQTNVPASCSNSRRLQEDIVSFYDLLSDSITENSEAITAEIVKITDELADVQTISVLVAPSSAPSVAPTDNPSGSPSEEPTLSHSVAPTSVPTSPLSSSSGPSVSSFPSSSPTFTAQPTTSSAPSDYPT